MARSKQRNDTRLRYDFETLYKWICADRKEESISDKEFGIICGNISERQVRNAKIYGMDFYQLDRFCTGYKCEAKYIYKDYVTVESLFADELRDNTMTWEDVIEQASGTFWVDQPVMRQLAFRNLLSYLTPYRSDVRV